jgi:hypothetical protein
MRILSTILAIAASVAVPAVASASPDSELASAEQRSRHDSMRVKYHGELATIAARDLMTARTQLANAAEYRDAAIRKGDSRSAAFYARRHHQARMDVREAWARLARETNELMVAREDFQRDAALIVELDAISRTRVAGR